MSTWLVSSKPSYFDALEAFEENELIDWGNGSNNKIEVGDIVYIYVTENIKEIKIKTQVTKINLTSMEVLHNDDKYFKSEDEKRLNNPANNFFRLKRLKIFSDETSSKLSLDILRSKGLASVQGKTRISQKIISYINQIENNYIGSKMNIKNIILYGAPGVGKTHNYRKLITMIEEGKSQNEIFASISKNEETSRNNELFESIKKRVEFVTFHQSYSYEDFIEGFRPHEDGTIKLKDGIFKKIALDAQNNLDDSKKSKDEVKNKNTFTNLIEEFKLYVEDKMSSDEEFMLKGKATIDIALRRRFTFLKMQPKPELVKNLDAQTMMKNINNYINEKLGQDYMLGHSYFMKVLDTEDLEFVKEYKIKPLLEECFYADDEGYKNALDILEQTAKEQIVNNTEENTNE